MPQFDASVQYGDWKGAAKADDADQDDICGFLLGLGLISSGEYVVGLSVWVGENHGGQAEPPVIEAFVVPAASYEQAKHFLASNDPVKVRRVPINLTLDQFVGRFKRFSIAMGRSDLGFIGRDYEA
jgi:hypothetical protein